MHRFFDEISSRIDQITFGNLTERRLKDIFCLIFREATYSSTLIERVLDKVAQVNHFDMTLDRALQIAYRLVINLHSEWLIDLILTAEKKYIRSNAGYPECVDKSCGYTSYAVALSQVDGIIVSYKDDQTATKVDNLETSLKSIIKSIETSYPHALYPGVIQNFLLNMQSKLSMIIKTNVDLSKCILALSHESFPTQTLSSDVVAGLSASSNAQRHQLCDGYASEQDSNKKKNQKNVRFSL